MNKTDGGINKHLIQILGFLGGAIILIMLSVIQKIIIGAPLSIKGFIVPFIFGGTVGYLLGFYISKLYKTIKELDKSEKRSRAIFEGSYDGIVFSDTNGNIILGNKSICDKLGYSQDELCTRKIKELFSTPDNFSKNIESSFQQLKVDDESDYFEIELIAKEKTLLPVEVSLHKLSLDNRIYNWAVIRDISERKKLEHKIYETMIGAEENERERYAKELHDVLGPILSTTLIYLHSMHPDVNPEKFINYRERVIELLEETIQTIKNISNNLSHDTLNRYGLETAIESFTERLKPVTGIEFLIKYDLDKRLPETTEFTLYRTLIELVNNTIKHAHASQVGIVFQQNLDGIKILYNDDGQGFEYESKKKENKGFGLANLESRINKIGGYYNFFSEPGKGVKVEIKLQSQENES